MTATIAAPITEDAAGRQLIKKADGTLHANSAGTVNGGAPGGDGTIPEPCSAMLLMLGAAALLRRRK